MQETTPSPLGNIQLTFNDDKLISINYTATKSNNQPQNQLTTKTINELNKYFNNPNYKFNIDLELNGTPFQQKVWQALQKIPTGKLVTYGDLAKQLNTSPRAIGNACRSNPIPIIIPCHRVVAQNDLGGYSGKQHGKMMNIKKWLIQHENGSLSRNRG